MYIYIYIYAHVHIYIYIYICIHIFSGPLLLGPHLVGVECGGRHVAAHNRSHGAAPHHAKHTTPEVIAMHLPKVSANKPSKQYDAETTDEAMRRAS